MADNNSGWLKNLQRLFSKDVLLRDKGNGRLRAIDINSIQKNGSIEQNYIASRYSSIYSNSSSYASYPNQTNFHILRQQLYQEYELMDRDAIISSALNVYAQEATLKNDEGNILGISSSDEEIKSILINLFYDVLNIEFTAYSWIRSLCRYGDHFLWLKFAKGYGIVNAIPMSAYGMERLDDLELTETRFMYNNGYANGGRDDVRKEFENYEVAHFRLMDNTNLMPYGTSILEGGRLSWRSLSMVEEAALSHRIIRSADRRAFFIYTGAIPANERDTLMQNTMNQMKKTPLRDPQSGDYDLRYNMMNMFEDVYIPVVDGDNKTTRIETLNGLNFAGMEDVEYYKNKLFAALQVPKAILTDTDGGSGGKATFSQLHLLFAQRIERVQAAVLDQFYRIATAHLYALGFRDSGLLNFELTLQSPSIIYEQEKIALLKEKVDLAVQMKDNNLFPTDYLYETIFKVSEDMYDEYRDLLIEDKKRDFRYAQIENEGNDPVESGRSYGTPHDLAMAYQDKTSVSQDDIPDEYKETNPAGRPFEHASTYGTDDSEFGRDALNKPKVNVIPADKDIKHNFRGNSPFSLYENKAYKRKVNLYEHKSMFEKMNNLSIFDINELEELKNKES